MRVKDKDGKEEVGAKKKFATRQLLFVATKPYFTIASLTLLIDTPSVPSIATPTIIRVRRCSHVRSTFPGCQYLHQRTIFFFAVENSGIGECILRRIDKLVRSSRSLTLTSRFSLILIDCYSYHTSGTAQS